MSSLTSRMSGDDHQGLTVQCPSEQIHQSVGSICIHDPTKESLTGPSGTEMPPPSPASGATREIFRDLTRMNKENKLGFNSLVWNGMALKNHVEEKEKREKAGHQQLSNCVVMGSQKTDNVLNFRCARRNRRRLQKRVKLKRKW